MLTAGTVGLLVKSITTKGNGVIATYKLNKNAAIPVLFLPDGKELTQDQLARINAILQEQK